MKAIITLFTICSIGISTACQAQTDTPKDVSPAKEDSLPGKQMNLLDEQVKIYDQIFALGGEGEDSPLGGATTYLELIEKMDISEEQKQELTEQYELIELGRDPQKEEEFRAKFNKMLKEAEQKEMLERQ